MTRRYRDRHSPDRHSPDRHSPDRHSHDHDDPDHDDHLGVFGPADPVPSDEVDVDELRAALRADFSDGSRAHLPGPPARAPLTRVQARQALHARRERDRLRTRRKRRSGLIALLVLALIAGGVVAGFIIWNRNDQIQTVRDYAGTGDTEVVIQVKSGDGLAAIADTLAAAQVVASPESFADSAANDADVAALVPGYYKVRQHSSAKAAADQLVDPGNRVGRVRLIPGRQLADVSSLSDGKVARVDGYLRSILAASCVPLNGQTTCPSMTDMQEVARSTPAKDLGVVEWALDDVAAAPQPDKRLEGMILPGDYDVKPGASAAELLKSVLTQSASQWNAGNVIAEAKKQGITPYQAAIIASIVEREGIAKDMPQVARVIDNRLAKNMMLQMDSSVNYAMNRAQIATSAADRDNPDPYNTYQHVGLPPTPISSPGPDALAATYDPAQGPWLFFVKVDLTGKSCFSVTEEEHSACVEKARANGVFDGN